MKFFKVFIFILLAFFTMNATQASAAYSSGDDSIVVVVVDPPKETPVCTVTNSPQPYTGSNQTPIVTIRNSANAVVASTTSDIKYSGVVTSSVTNAGTYDIDIDFTPDAANAAAYNGLSDTRCTGKFAISRDTPTAITLGTKTGPLTG